LSLFPNGSLSHYSRNGVNDHELPPREAQGSTLPTKAEAETPRRHGSNFTGLRVVVIRVPYREEINEKSKKQKVVYWILLEGNDYDYEV
jgi:hypothetical protein